MPNVGPIDGWRMATIARRPMCESARPRPTVVVVLPSPSGVGVIAETTTYLAFGRSASSSMASSLILATSLPYGSRRCGSMPMRAAMSGIGRRRALRAISRSGGNEVTAICYSSPGDQTRQCLLAPALGGFDLVEREEMQARHIALGGGELRQKPGREALRVVAAGLHHAHEPVGVALQESSGIAKADPSRDPQQLGRVGHSGKADVDGELDPATANTRDPFLHDPWAEAEIADDVGRDAPLVPHRLDRQVVFDETVALGVPGHADLPQAMRLRDYRFQQRDGVR